MRHPNSRSVLDDEIYDYSFWRHLYPVGDRSSDDNPVPGSNAVWPIQVDSQEDYDWIPAGAWVRDDYGKIVQKQPTPKPIVEPTPTPELGSSAEYIVLFSKAQADSVPNGKWVVDSLGKPWQQRRHVATFDASSLTSVAGVVAMFLVAGGVVFGLWKIIYSQGRPATQPNPEPAQKKSALVFSDYEQFKLATQLWSRDRSIFENNEAARLTQLGEWAKRGGPLTTIGFWVFAAATFFVGRAHGAGAGWGTAIFGLMVVGMLVSAEERFRRWRNKALFVRREFSEPEPVYQPPRQTDPPPPRRDPPPRSEPPPRAEPSRPVDPVRITTMRQAYEILGLPPQLFMGCNGRAPKLAV